MFGDDIKTPGRQRIPWNFIHGCTTLGDSQKFSAWYQSIFFWKKKLSQIPNYRILRRGCWVPQGLSICWVYCSVWLLNLWVEKLNFTMQNNSGKLKVHEIWDFSCFYPTSISMLSSKDSGDTSEIGLSYSHFQKPISFHSILCHIQLKNFLTVKKWPYIDNVWGLIKK